VKPLLTKKTRETPHPTHTPPMTKPFRVNFTPNHLAALSAVARLSNATALAVAIANQVQHKAAQNTDTTTGEPTGKRTPSKPNTDYWRRYLGDLVRDGLLLSKTIYGASTNGVRVSEGTRGNAATGGSGSTGGNTSGNNGKSGYRIGTIYALTKKGATVLAEATERAIGEVYYPHGGITSGSPFQFPHRAQFLTLMACFLALERRMATPEGEEATPALEVLAIIPYFRRHGSTRLGEGRAEIAVDLPTPKRDDPTHTTHLIPDAIVKVRTRGVVHLMAVELHRETSTVRIIDQLRAHTEAMRLGLFSTVYHHPHSSILLSIHEDADKLRNVIERLRAGEIEGFDRYSRGVFFGVFSDIVEHGIGGNLYDITGKRAGMVG
jgi:hypothetical protein